MSANAIPTSQRIIYIPFDHLHRNFGALKEANPDIVRNAQLMTAAFLQQGRMAYLTYATLQGLSTNVSVELGTQATAEEIVQLVVRLP